MRSNVIEGVLKIPSSAIEYSLDIKSFEKAVRYVVKESLMLDESKFAVKRINTIDYVTIIDIEDSYKDVVCKKLFNKRYSFSCDKKIKDIIMKNIFGDFLIKEQVSTISPYRKAEYIITFKVCKEVDVTFNEHNNNKLKIDLINKQIEILENKKYNLMK